MSINDVAGLEREADVMGVKALQMKQAERTTNGSARQGSMSLRREAETKGESESPREAIGTSGGETRYALDPSRTGPVIQRFEGPEHRALGDEALIDLRYYLSTSEGQAWAAANGLDADLQARINRDSLAGLRRVVNQFDETEYLERLGPVRARGIRLRSGFELTPGEVISLMGDFYETWHHLYVADPNEVRQLLAVMRRQQAGTISGTDASVEFQRITNGRYLELAERNDPHFATRGVP